MNYIVLLYSPKFNRIVFWISISIISYFAFTPLYVPEIGFKFGDKINHALAFIVLFYSSAIGLGKKISHIIAALVLYGTGIEIIQYFLPNRCFSPADVIADIIGIAIGYYALNISKRIFHII